MSDDAGSCLCELREAFTLQWEVSRTISQPAATIQCSPACGCSAPSSIRNRFGRTVADSSHRVRYLQRGPVRRPSQHGPAAAAREINVNDVSSEGHQCRENSACIAEICRRLYHEIVDCVDQSFLSRPHKLFVNTRKSRQPGSCVTYTNNVRPSSNRYHSKSESCHRQQRSNRSRTKAGSSEKSIINH